MKATHEILNCLDAARREGRLTEGPFVRLPDGQADEQAALTPVGRDMLPPAGRESEADFAARVIERAQLCGWRVAHFRPSRTTDGWRTAVQGDGKGFPDLLLLRGGRQIVAELKGAGGRLSRQQRDWLAAFEAAGVSQYIWTPACWPDIERILA